MKVSVIIPVLNDGDRLAQCLEKLLTQTYSDFEIIVVDNGSTEDIYSVCKSFSNVVYAQELKPGAYAARNKGISIAQGEILAFTDSDCLPTIDWIEQGAKLLISQNCGIVAGHIAFYASSSTPNLIEYLDSVLHLNQVHYAKNGYSATANLFTWAVMFDKAGLFSEVQSLGDREWCLRVSPEFGIVYAPMAMVWHPARSSLKALLHKIRMQAQHKSFWSWRDIWLHLRPCGWEFWRNVGRDRNLPSFTLKLQFVALIHYVRWLNVWEVLQIKFGGL